MLASSYKLWDLATPCPGKYYQSLSTSASDLDVGGSLDTLDGEFQLQPPIFGSAKHARAGVLARELGVSTSKSDNLSQDSINKQILAQLSALGDRLATLEHSIAAKCKKSPDVKK